MQNYYHCVLLAWIRKMLQHGFPKHMMKDELMVFQALQHLSYFLMEMKLHD